MSGRSRSNEREKSRRSRRRSSGHQDRQPDEHEQETLAASDSDSSGVEVAQAPSPKAFNVPPDFEWLSTSLYNQTQTIPAEMQGHFLKSNREIKRVKDSIAAMDTRVQRTDKGVAAVKAAHDKLAKDLQDQVVKDNLERRLMRDELDKILSSRPAEGSAGSAASTAAPAGEARGSYNPYQRQNLTDFS